MSSIKVAVRVRPFNGRERDAECSCCVSMSGRTTTLHKPPLNDARDQKDQIREAQDTREDSKSFSFDHSYWSHRRDSNYASQDQVYQDIGAEMLEHAFKGYNVCIFAYGQTGAGKSYTMMGTKDEEGIIPRMCNNLFQKLNELKSDEHFEFTVEVSYLEIYFERVRDLLNPQNKKPLKVREHNVLGPYVEDLTKLAVSNYKDIKNLIDLGNKSRTTAATRMNETSSRSHAVFTITLTQRNYDSDTARVGEKVSKISLVDLAGSERADSTGAEGVRLKEGATINKSLTTLGKVISALESNSKKKGAQFIPYRDSVLTWLLRENLGGNSKTAMIAAISPADINYDETLSTLNYANRTKNIVCKAVVNEDANAKIIRSLKEEIERLKSILQSKGINFDGVKQSPLDTLSTNLFLKDTNDPKSDISNSDMKESPKKLDSLEMETTSRILPTTEAEDEHTLTIEQLAQSEKLFLELQETHEQKLERTAAIISKLTEHQKELAKKTAKKWKHSQSARIRDEIWNNAPLLAEANLLALKRDKKVRLQFSLIRETLYSPIDLKFSNASLVHNEKVNACKPTFLAVEVQDLKTGAIKHWSLGKLRYRLNLVKNLQHGDMTQDICTNCDEFDSACTTDPFYDRHHWITIIGRSYLYLSNLLHPVTLLQKIPVINELGDVKGYLRIVVQAVKDNEELGAVPEMGSVSFNMEQVNRVAFDNDNNRLMGMERDIDDALEDIIAVTSYPSLRKQRYSDECYTEIDGKNLFVRYPQHQTSELIEQPSNYTTTIQEEDSEEDTPVDKPRANQLSQHLPLGSRFTFRITILQATDLPRSYTDVFCQFRFMHCDEVFSTKPIKNTRPPSGFYQVHNITVANVTNAFINYLKYHPIAFEVFGQTSYHPLHREATDVSSIYPLGIVDKHNEINSNSIRDLKGMPKRLLSHAVTPSPPIPPTKFAPMFGPKASAHVQYRFDILAWFEICELAINSDEYNAVDVDRSDPDPYKTTFLLHQGIQRKLCITLVHDEDPAIVWGQVQEVVVGRIRTTPEPHVDDQDNNAQSLAIFYAKNLRPLTEKRMVYRLEANWDTSLHKTTLLNKITPVDERVYLTVSAYLDLEGCCQPAVITRDLAVMIVERDSKVSRLLNNSAVSGLRSLFSTPQNRSDRCKHMTSVYELSLHRAVDHNSPRHKPLRKMPTSSQSTYNFAAQTLPVSYSTTNLANYDLPVAGEHDYPLTRFEPQLLLDSLQWNLEKIYRLSEVEKTRHILAVNNRLQDNISGLDSAEKKLQSKGLSHSKSTFSLIAQTITRSSSGTSLNTLAGLNDRRISNPWFLTLDERNLCFKYVRLMRYHIPTSFNPWDRESSDNQEEKLDSDFCPPPAQNLEEEWWNNKMEEVCNSAIETSGSICKSQLIPELEEVRLSHVVSKRGYLNYMEATEQKWLLRWFVVVRPYLIIYSDSRERVERDFINLTISQIELIEHETKIGFAFTLTTKHRAYLMQSENEKELHDWIYALNPLLAGQLKSRRVTDQGTEVTCNN